MKSIKYFLMIFMASTFGLADLTAAVYQEAGGYVVMEMEKTETNFSQCWTLETTKNPEGGGALRQAKCNNPSVGNPQNPLKYTFKINSAGVYTLFLKIWKDHKKTNSEPDKSNDVYVRVEGDFTTGGDASTEALKQDQKHYGGASDAYAWTGGKLDYDHKKWDSKYTFKAGQTYNLFISARAQHTVVDRILFATSAGAAKGKANGTPESSTSGTTGTLITASQSLAMPSIAAHPGAQNIEFKLAQIEASGEKAAVLEIYNVQGNLMKQIPVKAEKLSWDKTDVRGNKVPNGMYIAVVQMKNYSIQQAFPAF